MRGSHLLLATGRRGNTDGLGLETLGIDATAVKPTVGDTDAVGFTDVTGGSRVTFATGIACIEAGKDIVGQLVKRAALIWGCDEAAVSYNDGGLDGPLFTIAIDNLCPLKVPSHIRGIGANPRRFAKQDRTCQTGSDRVARCRKNGRADGPHKPDGKRLTATGKRQEIGRTFAVRRGQKGGRSALVCDRHTCSPKAACRRSAKMLP